MADGNEKVERVCGNCNYGFIAGDEAAAFCFCLKEPEFEPYLDDIIERMDYGRCRELVERKKFPADREACEEFEAAEICELSPECAEEIQSLLDQGRLTGETLTEAVSRDRVRKHDWAAASPEPYLAELKAARSLEKRRKALSLLRWLISEGNEPAFQELLQFLRDQPLPQSIEDVHLRVEILRTLDTRAEGDKALTDLLVNDLYRVHSNATTRAWYNAVLDYLDRHRREAFVREHLRRMLKDRRFSSKRKQRFREILESRVPW